MPGCGRFLLVVAWAIACTLPVHVRGAEGDSASLNEAILVDFRREIQPILRRACISCHGSEKRKGGLRLDNGAEALKGGNSGPVIVPGRADESRLFQLISGKDAELAMPPRGDKLAKSEIDRIRVWINQGAQWPRDATLATEATAKQHWSFQPIRHPAVPAIASSFPIANPIDAFVLARLEAEKITPSPEAERATLLRRLSLDLLGLPPTPQEVEDFLRDARVDAYERLVDRLLSSPHYGERWGRYWLDAARYADSDGFEKDTGRPFAWRYRHWVIDALNRDLPFDRFTVEQIAGDLLPQATVEQKVATGFHRNTLTNKEGGVDREQFRVEQVVDRVNTTAKVFLGMTLNCAQCHDHKYDPLSQREFYRFFAFFNSDEEVDIVAPLASEQERIERERANNEQKLSELKAAVAAELKDRLPRRQRQWEKNLTDAERKALPAAIAAIVAVGEEQRSTQQRKALTEHYAKQDKQLAAKRKAANEQQQKMSAVGKAQTIALGGRRPTHVMIRGDFLRKGVAVTPGTPAVLPEFPGTADPSRLDLAKWIADAKNPLTARVAVNWVWHKYFGRGLVATLEDFGTQGEKPSHPELLDWLASEFVRRHWSLKELHRLIVSSNTYRQSSRLRPELQTRDPLNIRLARQSRLRLEAELIRDNALAASGLLARTVGGPSVRPPQSAGISELSYAGSVRWVESAGADRYRRGLYTWFQRTSPFPMLMTFDAPDSNVSCVRRERSNTPLQALTLLNDPVFFECAQSLGGRIASHAGTTSERIMELYRCCVGRSPTDYEKRRTERLFLDIFQSSESYGLAASALAPRLPLASDRHEAAAWVVLARAMLNLDEFITRE